MIVRTHLPEILALLLVGCARTPDNRPVHVDIYSLASLPAAHEGRLVQVHGYYVDAFEGCALYPTELEAGCVLADNAVWVNAREPQGYCGKPHQYYGPVGQVVLEGRVTLARTMGFQCSLDDVIIVRKLPRSRVGATDDWLTHAAALQSKDETEQAQAVTWFKEHTAEGIGDSAADWQQWWWDGDGVSKVCRKLYWEAEQHYFGGTPASKGAASAGTE